MTPAEICQGFKDRFGAAVLSAQPEGRYPFVKVTAAAWRDAAAYAKETLGCESLHDLSAVDSKDKKTMEVQARLWSFGNRHWVNLKADVDRAAPKIASLEPLWKGADWHERECYDMFGIVFEGHPNLARILCPEDWVGWPLRKDYELPEYYEIPGIPVVRARELEKGRVFPPAKKAVPAKPAAAAVPAAAAAAAPAAAPKPAAPAPPPAPPPAPHAGGGGPA